MDAKEKLITIYFYICNNGNIQTWLKSHRMSNNNQPEFTDEEVMTIYLYGIMQKMREKKQIYDYINEHWKDWFPKLPKYQTYNERLNRLAPAFELLVNSLIEDAHFQKDFGDVSIIDSMPIMVAKNGRSSYACSAKEICSKGYCSSKDMYYYGLKLHMIGHKRSKTLPLPEYIKITPAHENDLTTARSMLERIENRVIVGDKIYADQQFNKELKENQNTELITPKKKRKKQEIKDAADEFYSRAVSSIRQPIESFFNWLNERTGIQDASKVRSTNGLLVHGLGRISVALLLLVVFNS